MRTRLSAYDKAVQLLAARPHFRRELEAKLKARGYPPEEIEEALGRLAEGRYLDDRGAAEGFVELRLAAGAEGRRRLAAELARRGADPEAAEAALSRLPEDDLAAAREAAVRWARRAGGSPENPEGPETAAPDPRRLAALARHLDRKGFSRRAIVTILSERGGTLAGGEETEEPGESDG